MISKAKASYVRLSSQKAELVIRTIRGKSVQYAIDLLSNLNKKASLPLLKLIKSALSNAESKGIDTLDTKNIVISRLVANQGPTLKRFRAATFGRAVNIRKRTSHIEVELDSKK